MNQQLKRKHQVQVGAKAAVEVHAVGVIHRAPQASVKVSAEVNLKKRIHLLLTS